MRLAALILCAALLFTSCTAGQPLPADPADSAAHATVKQRPDKADPPKKNLPPDGDHQPVEALQPSSDPVYWTPDPDAEPLGLEETIAKYFELHYDAYISLTHIDITELLEMNRGNRNLLTWMELLAMRRRLIWEYDFCYVERERFAYEILYIDPQDLTDQRMEVWDNGTWIGEDETVLHFVIEGEEGKAYPPMLAPNAQHTMRLHQVDGVWKIIFHYFPGSARKFYLNNDLAVPAQADMLAELQDEFMPLDEPDPPQIPDGAVGYDGALAAAYALRYTEQANPDFYHIGDWIGNCANFSSQCVWYGFGGGDAAAGFMTADWYGGEGGGTLAWENVEHFWDNITTSNTLRGQVLDGVEQAQPGDVIQTRSWVALNRNDENDAARFNHTLVVVDADALLLAQNSPSCFVYYSDLVAVEKRFVRPVSLLA